MFRGHNFCILIVKMDLHIWSNWNPQILSLDFHDIYVLYSHDWLLLFYKTRISVKVMKFLWMRPASNQWTTSYDEWLKRPIPVEILLKWRGFLHTCIYKVYVMSDLNLHKMTLSDFLLTVIYPWLLICAISKLLI